MSVAVRNEPLSYGRTWYGKNLTPKRVLNNERKSLVNGVT